MIRKNYVYEILEELNKDGQTEKVITITVMMNLLNTEDKLVILLSHGICYLLFSKCEKHSTIITPNHIKNLQNITNPSNLSTIYYEHYILHEKKLKKKQNLYNPITL